MKNILLTLLVGINLFFVQKTAYALPIEWLSKDYKASVRTAIDIDTSFWNESSEDTVHAFKRVEYMADYQGTTHIAGANLESYIYESSMAVSADAYYYYPTGDSSKGWAEGNFKGNYIASNPLLKFNYFLEDDYYEASGDCDLYSWLKVMDDSTVIFYDKRSITGLPTTLFSIYTPIGHQISVDFGVGAYVHASSTIRASYGNFVMNYNASASQAQVPEPCTMLLFGSLATGLFGFAELIKKFL